MAIEIRHAAGHRRMRKTVTIRRPSGAPHFFRPQVERLPGFLCERSAGAA